MHTLCTPLEGAPAPSCEHAMRLYTMSAASGMAAKDFGGAFVKSLYSFHSRTLLYDYCTTTTTYLYFSSEQASTSS